MFRRSNSNSNNFAAVAASAANAAAMAATVPRVHVTRFGAREIARFELPLAPRHVIPPQYKKDIITKAFRFHAHEGMFFKGLKKLCQNTLRKNQFGVLTEGLKVKVRKTCLIC